MNDNFENLNNISLNDLLEAKFNKRIAIIREFLDDKTIEFILKNNYDFINKIPISSLLKSAQFYNSLDDFDYVTMIKWFPIMLDYDRLSIILSYLKSKKMTDEEIVKILEKSVRKDFELADTLYENNYKGVSNNYLKDSSDLKLFINKSRINNETFNNLLSNNMKTYANLLRRLK